MALTPELIRTGAVFVSGLVYWIGVLFLAYRLKRRTGKSANLRPKGIKERLLWLGWLFVIAGWTGQPLAFKWIDQTPLYSSPALLMSEVGILIGLFLLMAGYAGTLWCYRILGDSWRVGVNRKEKTALIMSGPYRFVRHPIYAFQVVMLMGAALLLPTPFSLLLLTVHLICVSIKALDEERYLETAHGAAYRKYINRTGRLLPPFFRVTKTPEAENNPAGNTEFSATALFRPAQKNKKAKGVMLQFAEYGATATLLFLVQLLPFFLIRLISRILGSLFFRLAGRRRKIAIDNLTHAFGPEKSAAEIERLAQESFGSLVFTFLESAKFQKIFRGPEAFERVRQSSDGLEELFQKARSIHDESGGCIFATPHIGNWELLPHVSALVGIPLAVVVRPLDNPYLERLIYQSRTETGQAIIPKRNAFMVLQKTLQSGRSIGLLPDQSTMKGITIDFFGRPATATPVPALLAITHKRPIVVVACCRKAGGKYEGFVCDPIWPGEYESEKDEIFRITKVMTEKMEAIIRKYPEQYLWMHNRWKTYKGKKEFLS